jgi:hypothetical protein
MCPEDWRGGRDVGGTARRRKVRSWGLVPGLAIGSVLGWLVAWRARAAAIGTGRWRFWWEKERKVRSAHWTAVGSWKCADVAEARSAASRETPGLTNLAQQCLPDCDVCGAVEASVSDSLAWALRPVHQGQSYLCSAYRGWRGSLHVALPADPPHQIPASLGGLLSRLSYSRSLPPLVQSDPVLRRRRENCLRIE